MQETGKENAKQDRKNNKKKWMESPASTLILQ